MIPLTRFPMSHSLTRDAVKVRASRERIVPMMRKYMFAMVLFFAWEFVKFREKFLMIGVSVTFGVKGA